MLWGLMPFLKIMNPGSLCHEFICWLCHVTWPIWTKFCSHIPWRLYIKFDFNLPSGFRGEDVWKHCQTTDYRGQTTTTETTHTISSPVSQTLSWAKNSVQKTTIFFLFLNNWVLSVYGDFWRVFTMAAILVNRPNHLNKLLFLHPIKASNEIWLKFAQLYLKKKNYFVIFVDEWLVHWTLVLKSLSSIPIAGKKKFGDGTCFPLLSFAGITGDWIWPWH